MWEAWPGSLDCREPDSTGPCPSPTQDFQFILKGIARLLSNPLLQTYLPNSTKKIQFHQELLVLFWKLCDFNKVGWPRGPRLAGSGLPQGWGQRLGRLPAEGEGGAELPLPLTLPICLRLPPEIPLLCAEEQ